MGRLASAETTLASAQALAPLNAYAAGVFGSVAVEIVAVAHASAKAGGRCPALYTKPFYIFVRVLVALIAAGGLAVYLHAANEIAAIYLGASAPLVFDRMQRGLQPNHTEPD